MADAIVSLAIQRISDLLIQEAIFLSGVRDDVERLVAELKRMQAFLKDADSKKQQDGRLGNRVEQIRDLAYDAEDVIETFVLKAAQRRSFKGIIPRLASIFSKPFHLHSIGAEVKAIQTKLKDIYESDPAYKIAGEGEGSSSITMTQHWLRRSYSFVEEEDVISLEGMTGTVLGQLMTEEDRLHVVVSIVGMGGIGKTTLAKRVYNHIDVKQHFDCLAWAFISQKCSAREVLLDLVTKVHPQVEKDLSENQLMRRLFEVLKDKRYLVVLDDVWRIKDWESLKPAFPRGKKGSKILFTTRNKEVALLADPLNPPIELPLLSDDESWELFCKKAFPRKKIESNARLRKFEMLGREMVKKCGGLPLAIVVLGGLLATKSSWIQWEMVQRNIHAHLNKVQQDDHQYGAVNGILVLSYNELPYHLKPCFLYIGHYPEDWEISKKELIRLWIADGLISPSIESGGMSMEEVAEQFLEELIQRCLVQVGKRDSIGIGVKTCRIHDLLRDLCVDKAREQNFYEIIQPPLTENYVYHPLNVDVTSLASKRRIAIHPSERDLCLKGKHPKLRSLLFFPNQILECTGLEILECTNFKLLRVLCLAKRIGGDLWYVPNEIGEMHCLRYLKLACTVGIYLPQSIEKLKRLHTLHVEAGDGFIRNPDVVFKLERLRHILFSDFEKAEMCLPRDVSKYIETLKYVRITNLVESNVVPSLTNIRSLGVSFGRSEDVKPVLIRLVQSNRLQSLCMKFCSVTYPDLEPLSQCYHLSKLFLHGKIREEPTQSSHHHVLKFFPENIVKLTLQGSEVKLQDPMVVLDKLPHLRILRLLRDAYKGTKLVCSANGFLQLDALEIVELSELEEWEIEEGAMPCLRSLILKSVSKLTKFPTGLRYLAALKEMKLEWMDTMIQRIEVIDGIEGEDNYKVSHIPSIQTPYMAD